MNLPALVAAALVSLAFAACGDPSGGLSPDAGNADGVDAATCRAGEARCLGNDYQRCADGAFVTEETCELGCRRSSGCLADQCSVNDDLDGVGECSEEAPPDSFEPEIQWSWSGQGEEVNSWVTPLVANLTDDDGSGTIDLCDTPDVLVVATYGTGYLAPGHIYLLDGETGAVQLRFEEAVESTVTPAIGDIDGDGLPEIVTVQSSSGALIAFEHDGTVKWAATAAWPARYSGALALADADNDGDVEILAGNMLSDHMGNLLWTAPAAAGEWSASAFADLDGDGDLEIVLGSAAYHHDGTVLFQTAVGPGYPQIANLDSDPEPEVLVTNQSGITVLEHDGTVKFQDRRPTGDPAGYTTWIRPATIHDFDGDGAPEFAVSSASNYTVYRADGSIHWSSTVSDASGIAAGTAFDFLGDGSAEAMYADESRMFIFGDSGEVLLEIPRTSGTLSEYPVVADIDNDGSAEIVVVSNDYGAVASPTVQVIRDVEDRWIQARRIWNQHTYHVTNVREDATIPQFEQPSWEGLNTFRTNAQIENGGVCDPVVE